MATALDLEKEVWGNETDEIESRVANMTNEELRHQIRALDNEIRIMKSNINRIRHEANQQKEHIKDNKEKVKLNKQLPYLVANVVEIVEPYNDPEEDGGNTDLSLVPTGKGAVVKTSTRQTVFLPVPGLVRANQLVPGLLFPFLHDFPSRHLSFSGELVGVNKDSYIILEKLPTEYDSRVKAMEVDEKPTEDYTDIGGLDKQIQELIEAVVLPMTHSEKFTTIGNISII
jgi:26S proteasome regulatory subunit T5